MKKALLTLLIIILVSPILRGQVAEENAAEIDSTELKPKYGAYLHYGYSYHATDFGSLPQTPSCCPSYHSGSGNGMSFGLIFEMPFWEKYIVNLRAGGSVINGSLSSTETAPVMIKELNENNEPTTRMVEGKFKHTMNSTLYSFNIEPLIGYEVYDQLHILGGFGLSFWTGSEYDYKEVITQPDNGWFPENGNDERNLSDGELKDIASVHFGIMLGASYRLPMNEDWSWSLVPELFYQGGLTSVIPDNPWNIHQMRAGVAVKYKVPKPPPPPPDPPLPAPMPGMPGPTKPEEMSVEVVAYQMSEEDKELNGFDIRIEDFVSHNMRPLLNYLFFDHNSAEIPARYVKLTPAQAARFNMENLQNLGVMPTYYHILNIIGKRLAQKPGTSIKVIGCNSGIEEEKNNRDLSERRAIAVRDYLQDVWNIEEDRIKIRSRNMPSEPSSRNEQGGAEENRRVEIISNDWSLIEPVLTIDTLRKITKTKVRFEPSASDIAMIDSWSFTLRQGDIQLMHETGTDYVPDYFDWEISSEEANAPKHGGQIFYEFRALTKFGEQLTSSEKWLPVKQMTVDRKRLERIADKEFEYYSLILFDYGKRKLSKENRKVLNFIKKRITDNSNILITGYSDRLGEEDVNKRISDARAKEVARNLHLTHAKVSGIGESILLYNNDLPEGRFYCRTVIVTIETEINMDEQDDE